MIFPCLFLLFFILLSLTFPSICNRFSHSKAWKEFGLEKVNLQELDIMGWQAIGSLYGFLHGIIGVGFGVLVGHVTCTTIGIIL
jgi:hypothetical protein